MCGIVGFWDPRNGYDAAALSDTARRMAEVLQHRGPDGDGVWADPAAGIALAHRRLAIIDLSPGGAQPMTSASGRYVITYNGEIYNYAALRSELVERGCRFQTQSDTEVMLAAFETWGIAPALARLIGMFAIALWDRRERKLILIRDRLGVKPLYWGRAGGVLFFGSQTKAFRPHPSWRGEIDPEAISACLAFNYIPAPRSVWRGIEALRPGHFVTVDTAGRSEEVCYWDVRAIAASGPDRNLAADAPAAEDQLDSLLSDAVRWRLVADVPVGAFLSGGIDSSIVVAQMQRHSTRPVRTYTVGFKEAAYDESAHAGEVARHLGTDHTELMVTPQQARDVIPLLPEYYDEPFADCSAIPTFLVSQLARGAVTVSLSGDGGDEAFAGYTRYRVVDRIGRYVEPAPRVVRCALGHAITMLSPDGWDRLVRLLPLSMRPRRAGDRAHKFGHMLTAPVSDDFLNDRLLRLWEAPPVAVPNAPRPELTSLGAGRNLGDVVARMQLGDMLDYLPDDILVKLDRASMAVSLEGREPLLDHRVIEFAWRLPTSLKVRAGKGKWLLRRVLHRYVPPALVERPKMGFGVPIDSWLRGPLRDWAEDLLSERCLREGGLLDPVPIRRRFAQHQAGTLNWQYALWGVLMIQSWQRRWA
jgi:asparagine synthase (glutamine-hydrolysing)